MENGLYNFAVLQTMNALAAIIEAESDPAVIFRADNYGTRAWSDFVKIFGSAYARSFIHPILSRRAADCTPIPPDALPRFVFSHLLDPMVDVPRELCVVLDFVTAKFLAQWPDQDALRPVRNLFFLRFLCAALAVPSAYGFESIPVDVQQSSLAASKVLQAAVTGRFDPVNQQADLVELAGSYQSLLVDFCERLARVGQQRTPVNPARLAAPPILSLLPVVKSAAWPAVSQLMSADTAESVFLGRGFDQLVCACKRPPGPRPLAQWKTHHVCTVMQSNAGLRPFCPDIHACKVTGSMLADTLADFDDQDNSTEAQLKTRARSRSHSISLSFGSSWMADLPMNGQERLAFLHFFRTFLDRRHERSMSPHSDVETTTTPTRQARSPPTRSQHGPTRSPPMQSRPRSPPARSPTRKDSRRSTLFNLLLPFEGVVRSTSCDSNVGHTRTSPRQRVRQRGSYILKDTTQMHSMSCDSSTDTVVFLTMDSLSGRSTWNTDFP